MCSLLILPNVGFGAVTLPIHTTTSKWARKRTPLFLTSRRVLIGSDSKERTITCLNGYDHTKMSSLIPSQFYFIFFSETNM
jgi:hypothetical protein